MAELLLTCLARFRNHHCRLELPHPEHRCPCGMEWTDDMSDQPPPLPERVAAQVDRILARAARRLLDSGQK